MTVNLLLKPTPKGFRAMCDLFELSIWKGISAWGKTETAAITNLLHKWNKRSDRLHDELTEKHKDNPTVTIQRVIWQKQ